MGKKKSLLILKAIKFWLWWFADENHISIHPGFGKRAGEGGN